MVAVAADGLGASVTGISGENIARTRLVPLELSVGSIVRLKGQSAR